MTVMVLVVGVSGLHGMERLGKSKGGARLVRQLTALDDADDDDEKMLEVDYQGRPLDRRFFVEIDSHSPCRLISKDDTLRPYQGVAIRIGDALYQARALYRDTVHRLVLSGEILEPQILELPERQLLFVIQPWKRPSGIIFDVLETTIAEAGGEKVFHPCNVIVLSDDQLPKRIYVAY